MAGVERILQIMIYLSALYETLNATLDYNINIIYMFLSFT